MSVSVLNGPNLNLLGSRRPEVYGHATLADVEAMCRQQATALGLELHFAQTNHEGQLVDWVQEIGAAVAAGTSIGAVINPGAYAHTSVALRDAVEGARTPVVEVHISNVHARETFRHHSYLSPVTVGQIVGLGVLGYPLGIQALHQLSQPGSDATASPAGVAEQLAEGGSLPVRRPVSDVSYTS
ncbi:type II 3-dehydroquinate dehydratase [Nakamurella sp. YIM 132084]|uniref:3-dehydroquinate dehydratase n=1 Tax=Nakamurella leprariae TaxID=2803911 RepID=A0A938YKF5_9ACTN|nr:type II 3-dehydroquinate dehydratase [Nakamurella leprariae]